MANEIENTIDILMSLDPLELTAENIDQIILHHRKNRAAQAEGGKRSRPSREAGPKVDISGALQGLMAQQAEAPKPTIRRR